MRTLVTCMALSACAATHSLAQAPASIAGVALMGQATNGTGLFANSGFLIMLPSTSGSNYQFLGICGIGDQNGTYGYSSTGGIGVAGLDFMGGASTLSLDFQSTSSGVFSQTAGSDLQSGSFVMLSGQAPQTLAGVSLSLIPDHAALPFVASNILLKMAGGGNRYTMDSAVSVAPQHSTGNYSYSMLNQSTAVLQLNDSATGVSELYLAFADSLSGAYGLRQPSFGGYQVGSFRLWEITNTWSLWWQNTDGSLALWQMSGTNSVSQARLNPPAAGAGWRVVGTADFNADGQDDLLFESTNGALAVWFMNGERRVSSGSLTPSRVDPKWQVMCTGDFNNDGQKDIVWQNADGSLAVWLMNGLVSAQSVRLNPGSADPGWRIVGSGDFNGDQQTDLLWESATGKLAVWLMNGTSRTAVVYLNPSQTDPSWKVAGTKDFNGDGHPGIIWQQDTGALSYWQMDGVNCVHSGRLNPAASSPSWRVVGPQ